MITSQKFCVTMIHLIPEGSGASPRKKPRSSSSPGKGGAPQKYRAMNIVLEGVTPDVVRTLVIPADATFGWLHAVIQVAMGWTNSHLHQFQFGATVISDPTFEFGEFEGDSVVLNEHKERLMVHFGESRAVLDYEYDFGDSWHHKIILSTLLESKAAAPRRAVCLGGANACPPEDCGGAPGYGEFLKAIRNRKHPEHRSMQAWIGRPFDPNQFSLEATNRLLAKLSWPGVTISALAKVLSAPDGLT